MVKAIVAGCAGRMGGRIIKLIHQTDDIILGAGFEKSDHPCVGQDLGEVVGIGKLGIQVASSLDDVIDKGDVVIDFTHHVASLRHLRIAVEHSRPTVIGTTGFTQGEMEEIRELSKRAPCVLTPNMSQGINLMFKMVQEIATVLGDDFDVEIVEAHHRFKKDSPSGTALKLAQILAKSLNRNLDDVAVYGRKGMIGERKSQEIGIQAVRAGDIVGEHTAIFGGIGERIEFTHRAHSRDCFGKGALRAARWIISQKNGLYDMQDVLGLKE
jgi:4-hydroxy-tetrahydrodipicolinate reductase